MTWNGKKEHRYFFRCKFIDEDINILEYEISKILATNRLMPFSVYETTVHKWCIVLEPAWKNSIRYFHFMKDYRPYNSFIELYSGISFKDFEDILTNKIM